MKQTLSTLFILVTALTNFLSLSRLEAAAGDLFEADFTSGNIYRFAPNGSRAVYTTGLSGPEGLAFDKNGNLFVSETGTGRINKFATDGTQSIFASGLNGPASLVFDAAGNLFDADFFGGVIYKFTPNGTKTTFATGLNGPANLVFDSSGALLEADFRSGNIFRFTPTGTRSTFASNVGSPHGLAFDASGNLFVADFQGGTILRFTPSGTRSTFAAGLNGPHGLVFDAAGNLFSADYNSGNIYKFAPAGTRSTFASGLRNPANLLFQPARVSANNLVNLSTRASVQTGPGVTIGGFVVTGTDSKTVVLRGLGPTLTGAGVTGALADPTLQLFDGSGYPMWFNDNWKDTQQTQIQATGHAPPNDFESAILQVLPPGNYTAILAGKNGTTGVGLVEVYDISLGVFAELTNVSTRGFVGTGQQVMIGGFISSGGNGSTEVVVRGLGPTLSQPPFNLSGTLADTVVTLVDQNGTVVKTNDNWKNTQQADIQATGLAPPNDLESAMVVTVAAGRYTAILSGNGVPGTGIGLVEVYKLR
jgi:sugar lactone lactonase YvrE